MPHYGRIIESLIEGGIVGHRVVSAAKEVLKVAKNLLLWATVVGYHLICDPCQFGDLLRYRPPRIDEC